MADHIGYPYNRLLVEWIIWVLRNEAAVGMDRLDVQSFGEVRSLLELLDTGLPVLARHEANRFRTMIEVIDQGLGPGTIEGSHFDSILIDGPAKLLEHFRGKDFQPELGCR